MMRKRHGRWFSIVAPVVILALGLVSCGGDVEAPDEPAADLPAETDLPVEADPSVEADPPVETDPTVETDPPVETSIEIEIDLAGFAFVPRDVTIEVGNTVIWTNRDAVPHTVDADDDSWSSGNLDQGEGYRRTFNAPGSYEYHCKYHAAMVATITVE